MLKVLEIKKKKVKEVKNHKNGMNAGCFVVLYKKFSCECLSSSPDNVTQNPQWNSNKSP